MEEYPSEQEKEIAIMILYARMDARIHSRRKFTDEFEKDTKRLYKKYVPKNIIDIVETSEKIFQKGFRTE